MVGNRDMDVTQEPSNKAYTNIDRYTDMHIFTYIYINSMSEKNPLHLQCIMMYNVYIYIYTLYF